MLRRWGVSRIRQRVRAQRKLLRDSLIALNWVRVFNGAKLGLRCGNTSPRIGRPTFHDPEFQMSTRPKPQLNKHNVRKINITSEKCWQADSGRSPIQQHRHCSRRYERKETRGDTIAAAVVGVAGHTPYPTRPFTTPHYTTHDPARNPHYTIHLYNPLMHTQVSGHRCENQCKRRTHQHTHIRTHKTW